MEIRRTEQSINTEGGQILIEKVTDVPLLNKKEILDNTLFTLPLHTYKQLIIKKNEDGTCTVDVETDAIYEGKSLPIKITIDKALIPNIKMTLLPGDNNALYHIFTRNCEPISKRTEESSSREEFEEMLLDSEG